MNSKLLIPTTLSSPLRGAAGCLVVIGGGAAGFFCAVTAARLNPELKVVILEKTSKLLAKVKISGGGRCNVTHALFDITEMSKCYPRGQHYIKKTFHQFSASDTIDWFQTRGVEIKAERDGRMFPVTDSSQTIIDCLLKEADTYGVEIKPNFDVKLLNWDVLFNIYGSNGVLLQANYVCIASGAHPKSSGFQWLKNLGHTIIEPVPSLFTFNLPKHPITVLMGVSVDRVKVKIEATKFLEEGPLLITHWGLSGPAILRLSAWGARDLSTNNYEFKVRINWMPDLTDQTLKIKFQEYRTTFPSRKVLNLNFAELPTRLWQFLLVQSGISEHIRLADLPGKLENKLIKNLVNYTVDVKGKTTFKEEFVTAGGVHLNEVDAHTMMSKKVQNLFFAGEVLDVDGITGGFNFQHAWTSGWIAANSIRALL